jgi:hypothetical protein
MWEKVNRLFSIPKGFGKFYPKGSTGASSSKRGLGGKSGGGGGGGRPDNNGPDGPGLGTKVAIGVSTVVATTMILMRDNNGK